MGIRGIPKVEALKRSSGASAMGAGKKTRFSSWATFPGATEAARRKETTGAASEACLSPSTSTSSTAPASTPLFLGHCDSGMISDSESTHSSAHLYHLPAVSDSNGAPTADYAASNSTKDEGRDRRTLWAPDSWRSLPAAQDPFASLPASAVTGVCRQLRLLPPLISTNEVKSLLSALSKAQNGEAFLLQGGPCAEQFRGCREEILRDTAGLLLHVGAVMEAQLKLPVCIVGRIAGQYGKPRTNSMEKRGDQAVPTYRGDAVNGECPSERTPNADRMLSGRVNERCMHMYISLCAS
ncbi:phospho-2-dehydro-3-deoxyheptonate aldolase 1, chloroplastic-like [Cyclospora cayetanensis]|uniref:Phospho-2-dehydro-3-deoxyheptonate aldolase n=1 Tax=Cyclospora cayetanensis TaxID=88456 RepID=A0A6P6RXX7_9EIME|nr:phospho-2-dehydro-3-deoxyheptonate aldolase 1, chloroplastic-like [Cyclospora cayetanensis]